MARDTQCPAICYVPNLLAAQRLVDVANIELNQNLRKRFHVIRLNFARFVGTARLASEIVSQKYASSPSAIVGMDADGDVDWRSSALPRRVFGSPEIRLLNWAAHLPSLAGRARGLSLAICYRFLSSLFRPAKSVSIGPDLLADAMKKRSNRLCGDAEPISEMFGGFPLFVEGTNFIAMVGQYLSYAKCRLHKKTIGDCSRRCNQIRQTGSVNETMSIPLIS